MHDDAYELRLPKWGCRECGQIYDFPPAFCSHNKPNPDLVLPDATRAEQAPSPTEKR